MTEDLPLYSTSPTQQHHQQQVQPTHQSTTYQSPSVSSHTQTQSDSSSSSSTSSNSSETAASGAPEIDPITEEIEKIRREAGPNWQAKVNKLERKKIQQELVSVVSYCKMGCVTVIKLTG